MVLDAPLLNTQHYKIWIKVKWSNPGKGVAPPRHLGVVAIKKGAFRLPSALVTNFTLVRTKIVNKMSNCLVSVGIISNLRFVYQSKQSLENKTC